MLPEKKINLSYLNKFIESSAQITSKVLKTSFFFYILGKIKMF